MIHPKKNNERKKRKASIITSINQFTSSAAVNMFSVYQNTEALLKSTNLVMALCTSIFVTASLYIALSNATVSLLASATINHAPNPSVPVLADLVTDQMKENGFVFVNDSTIGQNITIDTKTHAVSGLELLSDLVTNISTFYMDDNLLQQNATFSYILGNVAGRSEIAKGINKVSGAPKQVLVTAHSEASYLDYAPLYLIFACPGLPDLTYGGQTTVYSIDRIVNKLMETTLGRNLLDEVAQYGVIYIRNDPHQNDSKHKAIWDAVNYPVWQRRFSGQTPSEITNIVTNAKQNATWIKYMDDNGNIYDTLRTEWKMSGFRLHPRTDKIVWFNQLYAMNGRYFNGHNVAGMDDIQLNDRPLNTLIGNGRQLTDKEYELFDNIHNEEQILIPWDNTGDILAIDNFVYQHGRMPYNSYRNCVINWGQAVRGGEYIYDPTHFKINTIKQDAQNVYKLVDEFQWYDTIFEHVLYRDENGQMWSAINSEEISMSAIESVPEIYTNIFNYRQDINVILHIHNPDIATIGMSKYSFLPIDQSYYMLVPVTKAMNNDDIIKILGIESRLLLTENNGMIVLGNKFEEAFTRFFYAIRAAQAQTLALNIHNGNINNIIFPSQEIQDITTQQSLNFNADGYGNLEFIAWKRRYIKNIQTATRTTTTNININGVFDSDFDMDEIKLRKDIVKAYHILDKLGWTESIYQHITGVLPSNNNIMLINAYGLEFGEVSINNLMKVAMNGTVLYSGDSVRAGYINPSGLALHAAVHEARIDAKIVIHCHHPILSAISVYKNGLLMDGISYHDFDSLSLAINKTVLANMLLDGNNVVILRNHGILTVGENVKQAFNRLYHTVQNAKTQIKRMLSKDFDQELCKLNSKYYNVWDKF